MNCTDVNGTTFVNGTNDVNGTYVNGTEVNGTCVVPFFSFFREISLFHFEILYYKITNRS